MNERMNEITYTVDLTLRLFTYDIHGVAIPGYSWRKM